VKSFNVKVSNLKAADPNAPNSKSTDDGRGWPAYLFGGRVRTSTAALIVAFVALFWVHQTFTLPAVSTQQTPEVVPPGFVPDPNYTWVPRTNVRQPREPVVTTTPTTTETTSPTNTTTTSPTSPTETPSTTVVDPDGLGPAGPQTITPTTPATTPTTTDGGGFGLIPLPTIAIPRL
jgi:hypothetical protein